MNYKKNKWEKECQKFRVKVYLICFIVCSILSIISNFVVFSNIKTYVDYKININDINEDTYILEIESAKGDIYIPAHIRRITLITKEGYVNDIESIKVDKDNTFFYSEGNCVISKYSGMLVLGCKNSVIPLGTKAIADDAFYGVEGTKLYYDGTLDNWVDISFNSKNHPMFHFDEILFKYDGKYKYIDTYRIPKHWSIIPEYAFYKIGLLFIVIGDNITRINEYAFACNEFEEIVIPDSVKEIGQNILYLCTSINTLTTPFIGKHINEADSNLSWFFGNSYPKIIYTLDVTLETLISDYAFHSFKINNITYKKKVDIMRNAFSTKKAILNLTFEEGINSMAIDAFDLSNIKNIYFNDDLNAYLNIEYVKYDGSYIYGSGKVNLFGSCENLYFKIDNEWTKINKIVIPESITVINPYMFTYSNIKSIVLHNKITMIAYDAFYECSELELVEYNGTLSDWCKVDFKSLYSNPMSVCSNVLFNGFKLSSDNFKFDSSVNILKPYTFVYFDNLDICAIPESIKYISSYAFYACEFNEIKLFYSISKIESKAFYNMKGNTKVFIASDVLNVCRYAFVFENPASFYLAFTLIPSSWDEYWHTNSNDKFYMGINIE